MAYTRIARFLYVEPGDKVIAELDVHNHNELMGHEYVPGVAFPAGTVLTVKAAMYHTGGEVESYFEFEEAPGIWDTGLFLLHDSVKIREK